MSELPSKAALLDWIRANPDKTSKRDLARAFNIKGDARIALKRIIGDLKDEGVLTGSRRGLRGSDGLPPVAVLLINHQDDAGDLWARPSNNNAADNEAQACLYIPKSGDPALGVGDRILAKISRVDLEDHTYQARLIRKIGSGPQRIVGIYKTAAKGGRIVPIDKKSSSEWQVPEGANGGAKDGVLVEAEQTGPKGRLGLKSARVIDVLGDPHAPRAISLIAIHSHDIPNVFSDAALQQAAAAKPAALGQRLDLRDLPLFTIDPHDARDHDDAICALRDPDGGDGFTIWVAIADVAYYVRPDTALDQDARKRGNSTYFPDRVVPMLPDALSGDLCSLHQGVDRPCIALKMTLNAQGDRVGHEFHRAMMRSPASLSYEQAQAAADGEYDSMTKPLAGAIRDLFAAYALLRQTRAKRQPLNLDLPERQIVLDMQGQVASVDFKARLPAHQLVEEFMVMANVCAAQTLESKGCALLYRVHEAPNPEKLDQLRDVAAGIGVRFAKGQVLSTKQLNHILEQAAQGEDREAINMAILRTMTQAYYGPKNMGHFGLNLKRYAHFTSPIRRYADLLIHRALIRAHGWGEDGQTDAETRQMAKIGEEISITERRSMAAERDTNDRYLAAYLSEQVGSSFAGHVSGISKSALFVRLDATGADGIVPLAKLGNEYWHYRERDNTLKGDDSGRILAIGMPVQVALLDASAITGGLSLQILSVNGAPMPKGSARQSGRKPRNIKRRRGRR